MSEKQNQPEPLEEFFRKYPNFVYDPEQPASEQFSRLCSEEGWGPDSKLKAVALAGFKNALVRQFNTSYGVDENDLNAWHALLTRVRVKELPETVAGCKKVISGIYVNLVDLVDVRDGSKKKRIRLFRSEGALSDYTKRTRKFFPKEDAYAGNLLKFLLRRINVPSARHRRSRRDQGRSDDTRLAVTNASTT